METITKKSKKKTILLIVSIALIIFITLHYFLPSYHSEKYEGVEYYSDASYSKLGFGLNRYGKIASKYLPDYETVSQNATYLNFMYYDGGIFLFKTVEIRVGARYDETTYLSKRKEILEMGTDLGKDYKLVNNDSRHYRLIEKKHRVNGEYIYFVISCCDRDNAIEYLVLFDTHNYDHVLFWDEQTMVFFQFWDDLHTGCATDE